MATEFSSDQRDLVVEACHDQINRAIRIELNDDDPDCHAGGQECRAKEAALRAALAEIDRLTALTNETAKLIDNIKPFMVGALPTHKDRGGEGDRQKLCKWMNKLRDKL